MEEQEDGEEAERCAICFEHERPFVSLPCSCHVNYCAGCWDRALATSVTVRGQAQCPSCRTFFTVDFEPEAGGLVFSPDLDGSASVDWKARVYGKAKPVQIKLLQDYSVSVARCTTSPTRTSGTTASADAEARAAATNSPGPLCVCGKQLEHLSSRGRILRMLQDTDSDWRNRVSEAIIQRLLVSSVITCDLCGQVATRSGGVWTCKAGPHTILHPAAYDVCEQCFTRYAGSAVAALWGCGRDHGEGQHLRPGCFKSCWHSCAAMVGNAFPWNWARCSSMSDDNMVEPI